MRPIVLPVLLLALAPLAGCLGGSGAKDVPLEPSASVVASPVEPSPATPLPKKEVPKYHPHNNWGTRSELTLFNEWPIDLGQSPLEEARLDSQTNTVIVGDVVFDTRVDGDDSTKIDKADTVFQGTRELLVKVSWDEDPAKNQIKGLTFKYKPANTPLFTSVLNVPNGGEFKIQVGRGMADMPHSFTLSRWRFGLEAYDPDLAGLGTPGKAFVARGQALLTIKAINGGQVSIDPPHPYFFLDGPLRFAGEINKTIDAKVVRTSPVTGAGVPLPLPDAVNAGGELTGWKVPAPHIVPWESTVLHAYLFYNHTGSTGAAPVAHELGLTYTDASGPDAKTPVPTEKGAGWKYYKIPVKATDADDPYATSSVWTYGVYPILQDTADLGGEFQGNVHLLLIAEGKSDTGMTMS